MISRKKTIKILVTGAYGFLGSAIVRQATQAGFTVRATDRITPCDYKQAEFVPVDILKPESLTVVMNGIDVVIHAAGLAHVFDKSKGKTDFTTINEFGTANIALAAAKNHVKHLILISSVSVYGRSSGPCHEDCPCHPENAYAKSKYQAELCAEKIALEYGMDLTILRMATVYGENDPGNVGRLIRIIDQGCFFWVGNGANHKSLIYREDAASACLAVLGNASKEINIYNVSAKPCTMLEIVQTIASCLERPLPAWHIPAWLVLSASSLAAILSFGLGPFASVHRVVRKWFSDDIYPTDKIRQELEFCPMVALDEGIRHEVAWYRKN